MIDLEKNEFNSKGLRFKILGKITGYYNGKLFKFESIEHNCRLQKINEKYYLHVPFPIKIEKNNIIKNKQITIDPGIRRFCTGITENKIIKIGEKCGKKK